VGSGEAAAQKSVEKGCGGSPELWIHMASFRNKRPKWWDVSSANICFSVPQRQAHRATETGEEPLGQSASTDPGI